MDDRVELVAAASVCAGLSALICLMPMADMGLPQWVFLATAGSGAALFLVGLGVLAVRMLGERIL
jgi:hypothetical protein